MKYLAFCTKGLEFVCQQELIELGVSPKDLNIQTKRITFSSELPSKRLMRLRTIDDLHLFVAEAEVKSSETAIDLLRKLEWEEYRQYLEKFRSVANTYSFTVQNYRPALNLNEVTMELTPFFQQHYKWHYTARDHSNFDIRLSLEQAKLTVSIRISTQPLFKRIYKQNELPGSLRPSIAASLVYLAKQYTSGNQLVDNFCGSGTILAEALHQGFQVSGGDINPESVNTTVDNLANIKTRASVCIQELDATNSPWPESTFDVAVSNLPYGKQISVDQMHALYKSAVIEYHRILKPNGVMVLLNTRPEVIRKFTKGEIRKEFQVGFIGQTPWVQVINQDIQ